MDIVSVDEIGGSASGETEARRPAGLVRRLAEGFIRRVTGRRPDFIIGGADDPYLRRWWVIPRNRWFNIYLHEFRRSDDDRALHDHPWWNLSVLLRGSYVEHTIRAGGVHHAKRRYAGELKLRSPACAHRIEIDGDPCWTIFMTGPVLRTWGFHCPRGWVPWKRFVDDRDSGEPGLGCADPS